MDGAAAPCLNDSGVALTLSEREKEQLDTAWRVLRQRPFNGTCLRRAIVGGYFLRAHDPLLRIGVAKDRGRVTAHAWIEVDGVSLDPDGPRKYMALAKPSEEDPC